MLKKMVMNIGGVSFVLAAIMLLAMLSSVLLGRTLSAEEFGEFALMRTLVLFIAPLAVWGQDVATARFFARNNAQHFKWSQAFRTVLRYGSILVVLGVLVAAIIYKLAWPKIIVLAGASIAYVATLFVSNLMRGSQRYCPAILMLNGFRGAFFLIVLVLYFTKSATATTAILAYYGVIVVLSILNISYTFKAMPQGDLSIPREMHTTGLLFMGSQASVTLIGSLDSLFIPGLLDLASLAVYQAAVVPSQVFNIVGRAGKYVWVPEFGRSKSIQMKKISFLVSIAAAALLAVMLIFAEPILHLLFDGKYDHGANILRLLAVAGTLRLFYNLGSSIIIGKLEKDALVYHLVLNIAMVFIEIGLLFFFIKNYAVIGAALTVLCVTLLRTIGSFSIVYKFRHQLN
jgi:O-antigen/teichoic acid export membrane protein